MTALTDATPEPFPLSTFAAAAEHLRRPFPAEAIKSKLQSAWPKGNPTAGLVVFYIDARLVSERLNLVCPSWSNVFDSAHDSGMVCRLTVCGVTREDVGTAEGSGGMAVKALRSDALKRAAVLFGVGVSVYAIPQMFVKVANGTLKVVGSGQTKKAELTDAGRTAARAHYRRWLEGPGVAFGEPLGHGHGAKAQGDPGETPGDAVPDAPVSGEVPLLGKAARDRVLAAINAAAAKRGLDDKGREQERALIFAAVGLSDAESMTAAHAFGIREALDAQAGKS